MQRGKSVEKQEKKHNKVTSRCWLTCTQFTRRDGEVRIVKGVVGLGSGRVDPAADGWSGREEGRMEWQGAGRRGGQRGIWSTSPLSFPLYPSGTEAKRQTPVPAATQIIGEKRVLTSTHAPAQGGKRVGSSHSFPAPNRMQTSLATNGSAGSRCHALANKCNCSYPVGIISPRAERRSGFPSEGQTNGRTYPISVI